MKLNSLFLSVFFVACGKSTNEQACVLAGKHASVRVVIKSPDQESAQIEARKVAANMNAKFGNMFEYVDCQPYYGQ